MDGQLSENVQLTQNGAVLYRTTLSRPSCLLTYSWACGVNRLRSNPAASVLVARPPGVILVQVFARMFEMAWSPCLGAGPADFPFLGGRSCMCESFEDSARNLLKLARHDPEALNQLLGRYRPFLALIARHRIDRRVRKRCDESDVVQQTMFDVSRKFDQFSGETEAEFRAWLARVHKNNLIDLHRRQVDAIKRSPDQEVSLCSPDGDASVVWYEPAANLTTASQKMVKAEDALSLAAALGKLPEMQREAVRLRHIEGASLTEISEQLGKSVSATAGLIKRGIKALRVELEHLRPGRSTGS